MPKLVVPRWPRSATEGTEYQKDFKFCISCAEVYGGSSWAALKREVINPRFVAYIDICARGVLGNSSLSSVPTPTNTAALESIWSSLDRVATLSGYTTPARYRLHHRHNSGNAGADHSPRRCRVFLHHHVHDNGTKPAISCNVHTPHVFHQPDIFLNRSRQPEKSSAWIAGPITGGVVGLLLIAVIIGFFVMRRRRRAQKDGPLMEEATPDMDGTFNKAQLHSDPIVYASSELQDDRTFWAGVTPASVNEHPVELPTHGPGWNAWHGRGTG